MATAQKLIIFAATVSIINPSLHANAVQVEMDSRSMMKQIQKKELTRAETHKVQRDASSMHSPPEPQDNLAKYGVGLSGSWGYRDFVGADPSAGGDACLEDKYTPSEMEMQWYTNAAAWLDKTFDANKEQQVPGWLPEHCAHLPLEQANAWIQQNANGNHDPKIFSKVCRKGQAPQYIEPLAGILRDPRYPCNATFVGPHGNPPQLSVDWLVFAGNKAKTPGAKARFYDAGGSQFKDAMQFFLDTYKGQGILFDEIYVWEAKNQGTEVYWDSVDPEVRKFWEPRLTFYDGIGVSSEKDSDNNPASRIFKECKPEDFCAFKLDIDTPPVEAAITKQLLDMPEETKAKLDEFYFEKHCHGFMEKWWGGNVDGTFPESYQMFTDLRNLGVRAHSWV